MKRIKEFSPEGYCCLIALRPRLTTMVITGRSVNLTTLFLGRLKPSKRLISYKGTCLVTPVTENCPS